MNEEQIKELTLTRTFDAPKEAIWKYWTTPKLIQMWWGPKGVSNPTCVWDVKVGGEIHIVMLAGKDLGPFAGQEWPMTGKFLEVAEPTKLIFTSQAIMYNKPILETRVSMLLTEEDSKTVMTIYIVVTKTTPEAEGALAGMEAGWNQQLDKLVEMIGK